MTKTTHKPGRKPAEKNPRWVAFGKRLVDLRKARGWLALDVARSIDVDPVTMSRIETGDRATGPERETLDRLARFYNMSVDELMGERQPAASQQRHERPETANTREVFPRADAGAARSASIGSAELAAIRAAVSDAMFAAITDIFESVAAARARTAAQPGRETEGTVSGASAERARSGTTGR